MDIQTKKINFIQEFLRIKNIELVERFEKLLQKEKKQLYERQTQPMTLKKFNKIIDDAEDDAKKKRVTEAKELRKDIDSWR